MASTMVTFLLAVPFYIFSFGDSPFADECCVLDDRWNDALHAASEDRQGHGGTHHRYDDHAFL